MGEIRAYLKDDEWVCGSVEEFFSIIQTDPDAVDYISSLMQYIINATTKVIGGWLIVEDAINLLILKHFWQQRCDEGMLGEGQKLKFRIWDSINKLEKDVEISYEESLVSR